MVFLICTVSSVDVACGLLSKLLELNTHGADGVSVVLLMRRRGVMVPERKCFCFSNQNLRSQMDAAPAGLPQPEGKKHTIYQPHSMRLITAHITVQAMYSQRTLLYWPSV